MQRLLPALVISVCLLVGVVNFASAGSSSPFLVEYTTPGGSSEVTVESAGHIWATQPSQNSIARLVVTSPSSYTVTPFALPTLNAEPYDIKYANGWVWFTERVANKIGRLDPATGTITECTIPTANSQPTGIDVFTGSPAQVWFAERNGNKLAMLLGDNPLTCTFAEYVLPAALANAQPEGVAVLDNDHVWFTAPGVSVVGRLQPSRYPDSSAFELAPTGKTPSGSPTQPWKIALDSDHLVWFTDQASSRVAKYFPGTLFLIRWYMLPDSTSTAYDIQSYGGLIWFTEPNVSRVGQLEPLSGGVHEFALAANRAPMGLAIDGNGAVWIAENGRNVIASWLAPYFNLIYMPFVPKPPTPVTP